MSENTTIIEGHEAYARMMKQWISEGKPPRLAIKQTVYQCVQNVNSEIEFRLVPAAATDDHMTSVSR